MQRERDTLEYRQVAKLIREQGNALLFDIVVGRSGINYLITGITPEGLRASMIDFPTYDQPEKVLLPNDANIIFAKTDSVKSRCARRIEQLIKETMEEAATTPITEQITDLPSATSNGENI